MICSQCMSVSMVGSEKTCFTAFLYESPSLVLGNPPVFRRWRTRNFSWWTYHFFLFILIFPSGNPHLSWNHPLFHSTIWLLNISMEHFPGPFMDDFPICTHERWWFSRINPPFFWSNIAIFHSASTATWSVTPDVGPCDGPVSMGSVARCFLGHHGKNMGKNMGKQIGKWSGKHMSCANITNSMGISPTVVLFVVYPTSFHGGCKSRNITG